VLELDHNWQHGAEIIFKTTTKRSRHGCTIETSSPQEAPLSNLIFLVRPQVMAVSSKRSE
jgi:hypothetical protein